VIRISIIMPNSRAFSPSGSARRIAGFMTTGAWKDAAKRSRSCGEIEALDSIGAGMAEKQVALSGRRVRDVAPSSELATIPGGGEGGGEGLTLMPIAGMLMLGAPLFGGEVGLPTSEMGFRRRPGFLR